MKRASYLRLRLVKENLIFLPLSLSFLFTVSIKVLRSLRGFSAMILSFLSRLNDTGLIIAYVRS